MKKYSVYKVSAVLITLLLILTAAMAVSMARIKDVTQTLDNEFQVGEVKTEIKEPPVSTEGGVISKMPVVKNIGKSDCIVRMRVTISPEALVSKMDVDYQSNVWKLEEDGFYYYQGIVAPGKSTIPLFTSIKGLTDDSGKAVDGVEDFQITLYQESIQTAVYEDGKPLFTAYDENGLYQQANALKVWAVYQQ